MLDSRVDRAMAAVRRHDELVARRAQLIGQLDREIAAAKAEVVKLVGGSTPMDEVPEKAAAPSVGDKIVDALREQPGMKLGDLAVRAYGSDSSATRHKLHAMLSLLKKKKRVQPRKGGKPGEFEAVEPLRNGGIHANP